MGKFLAQLFIVGTLLLPSLALAWDDPGHIAIAAAAYQQLLPELKAQVFAILKAHPSFAQWQKSYLPNPVLDLPATVFLHASTWPDDIRGSGSPYDHPQWHFIDYPLIAPDFPFKPDQQPTNNVLYGIAQCEAALSDIHASAEWRAVSLAYLIHLVGDLHQPLHCASFYSSTYPDGDRGGNDFYVIATDHPVRLHAVWDELLGTTVDRRQLWNYGAQIRSKYPRAALTELSQDPTPLLWSRESRQLAIQYGYLNGHLAGSTRQDNAPALPADYLATAKPVAERQAALAGDRLADEIARYLKWNQDLPYLPPNTNMVDTAAALKISVDAATQYYDENLVVTGRISRVMVNLNSAFIRFRQTPGTPQFTAIIFKEHFDQFGDLQKLVHQAVELNGKITQYRGRPEIILQSPEQLKVVGE